MTIRIVKLHHAAIVADVMPKLAEKARRISRAANRNTRAPAGFTYEVKDDHVLLGPTGAAGLPVEIGTLYFPARRPFKRAADADRDK